MSDCGISSSNNDIIDLESEKFNIIYFKDKTRVINNIIADKYCMNEMTGSIKT